MQKERKRERQRERERGEEEERERDIEAKELLSNLLFICLVFLSWECCLQNRNYVILKLIKI